MRADLEIIQQWIPANSRVLDLGCGNGELLSWLQEQRNVTGYGLEIDPDNIAACIDKGDNAGSTNTEHFLQNFIGVMHHLQGLGHHHYIKAVISKVT